MLKKEGSPGAADPSVADAMGRIEATPFACKSRTCVLSRAISAFFDGEISFQLFNGLRIGRLRQETGELCSMKFVDSKLRYLRNLGFEQGEGGP